jgi:hypothetical protein
MEKDTKTKDSDQPLLVYPPYMSRFLWVTLLLMIALGFTAPLVAISFLEVSNEWMVPVVFPPVFIFIILNILVVKGIPFGISGLKVLSYFCLAFSVLGILFNQGITLCLVSAACSLLGLMTITGEKYQEMFRYMQGIRALRRVKAESLDSR